MGDGLTLYDLNYIGLVQLEKHALKLVAKPAPRANPDLLLDYLAKYPTVDGVFTAWDTAHKVRSLLYSSRNKLKKKTPLFLI